MPQPKNYVRTYIVSPIKEFIGDSRAVGITLICCTVISLIISNTGWSGMYTSFWEKELLMPIPEIHLPHTILHVINDAAMAVFFFLVGAEIKRELMIGELSSMRKAILPAVAALGGMVVPAFIYLLWTGKTPYANGWGIPMATDIAFSLGILSLLGKKAPLSLRIFLTALAIIDDLGGILAIAIFYAKDIQLSYLLYAAIIMAILTAMNMLKVKRYYLFYILGAILWYVIYNSGVHATVAGVLLAFTIPLHKIDNLEHALHDPVNFIILPVFALANTAIVLPKEMGFIFSSEIHHGILSGLALGKPLGIIVFSTLAVKAGIAELPMGMSWRHLLGMGMIAGIGFTMSIFMATLAFDLPGIQLVAKVALLRLELKISFLPSGENIGKASKPPSCDIFSRPVPSKFIRYILKGKPLSYSWLDAKMIRLPSAVKFGAQLALPSLVTCCTLLPSASAINTSMLVGATMPCFNRSVYSFTSSSVLGRDARHTIFLPSGENHAPPS
ncbi:MAG: Na+/H+ antiporter NhaA [Sphingobacteriales bacterium]|nr:MAG: Na+/H+ antiporter NhaA [Sphingobacteriales bacterium]